MNSCLMREGLKEKVDSTQNDSNAIMILRALSYKYQHTVTKFLQHLHQGVGDCHSWKLFFTTVGTGERVASWWG